MIFNLVAPLIISTVIQAGSLDEVSKVDLYKMSVNFRRQKHVCLAELEAEKKKYTVVTSTITQVKIVRVQSPNRGKKTLYALVSGFALGLLSAIVIGR